MLTETDIDTLSSRNQGEPMFQHEVIIPASSWEIIQKNMHYANTENWGKPEIMRSAMRRLHHAVKVREMFRRTGLAVFFDYREVLADYSDIEHTSYLTVSKEGFSWARTERVFEILDGKYTGRTGAKIIIAVFPGAPLHTLRHHP